MLAPKTIGEHRGAVYGGSIGHKELNTAMGGLQTHARQGESKLAGEPAVHDGEYLGGVEEVEGAHDILADAARSKAEPCDGGKQDDEAAVMPDGPKPMDLSAHQQ